MNVFPQLSTGAAALYPLQRVKRARTVVNVSADGRRIAYEDTDTRETEWEFRMTGLAAAERVAIETLFDAVSGRWGTFTLLEPAGNLLAQSEAFGNPEWNNGPLVELTTGIGDPFGGTRAVRAFNAGSAAQDVAQPLEAPGNFQYALSVWARQNSGPTVTLFASTTGGSVERDFALTTDWQRIVLPVALGLTTSGVTFGARLGPSIGVDLFGMQVEAQPAAGAYQQTGAGGGVYANARFVSDVLTVRAQGTDVFDAVIQIISKGK